MEKVLFREVQKFRQVWLWLLMAGILLVTILSTVPAAVGIFGSESKMSEDPSSVFPILFSLIFPFLIVGSISLLMLVLRFETEITDRGIYYKFFPFHLDFRLIEWKDIARCYVRKYRPVREYGGWGIRFGMGGRGRAYNVMGNMGLQLELRNGKKILFGTQQPEELKSMLENRNIDTSI